VQVLYSCIAVPASDFYRLASREQRRHERCRSFSCFTAVLSWESGMTYLRESWLQDGSWCATSARPWAAWGGEDEVWPYGRVSAPSVSIPSSVLCFSRFVLLFLYYSPFYAEQVEMPNIQLLIAVNWLQPTHAGAYVWLGTNEAGHVLCLK
jgi:hypothetical protein